MKHLIPFLAIFVLVNGESVRSYEGQSQETIEMLLSGEGKTGQVITEKEYNEFIEAHRPVVVPNTSPTLEERLQALETKVETLERTR
jgi:hypothetical protein